jgi:hypothetical protein
LNQDLPWKIKANINCSWNSASITPQGKNSGSTDYSISLLRSFSNNNLTVSFVADNFLQKYRKSYSFCSGTSFHYKSTMHNVNRNFYLSISYRFGKIKKEMPHRSYPIDNTDVKEVKNI